MQLDMPLRKAAHESATRMVDDLGELVRRETPPGDIPALSACADLLDDWATAILGRPAQRIINDGLPHLLWPARDQRILLLGHYDTVWPAGTIDEWPFTVDGVLARGPGVCDMKAGIVQMLTALTLLTDTSRIGLLLTCDEESGSATSRDLIEEQGRRSGAVLVGEASTDAGALKIARKGGSAYRIHIQGRAAHAGVEPHLGINAAVELAHQVLSVQDLANPRESTTVTPTVLSAGTSSNVVPESAVLRVDVRAWTREELDRVDQAIRALRPHLANAGLRIGGGINRYPLGPEVTLGLFDLAQTVAKDLGLDPLDGVGAPGASDGNFTGALGVPTLDGLGAVGGHAHARNEYVDISTMPDRAALLAGLMDRILCAPRSFVRAGDDNDDDIDGDDG